MPTVNSWNALMKEINKKVASTMQDEVSKVVSTTYLKHIEADVYDDGDPVMYDRRGSNGGLADPDNIKAEYKDGVLSVMNVAEPNFFIPATTQNYNFSSPYATQFASWIENGEAYNGNAKYIFPRDGHGNIVDHSDDYWAQSRPFTQHTIDDLRTSKKHKTALKDGLKKRGLTIK